MGGERGEEFLIYREPGTLFFSMFPASDVLRITEEVCNPEESQWEFSSSMQSEDPDGVLWIERLSGGDEGRIAAVDIRTVFGVMNAYQAVRQLNRGKFANSGELRAPTLVLRSEDAPPVTGGSKRLKRLEDDD